MSGPQQRHPTPVSYGVPPCTVSAVPTLCFRVLIRALPVAGREITSRPPYRRPFSDNTGACNATRRGKSVVLLISLVVFPRNRVSYLVLPTGGTPSLMLSRLGNGGSAPSLVV